MSIATEIVDLRALVERILFRHELVGGLRSPPLEREPSGKATERAGYEWARKFNADRRHASFAYLSTLAQVWTDEEVLVLQARHTQATPIELARRYPPETNERIRSCWRGDLVYEAVQGGLSHYRTRGGAVVIHDCHGNPDCGWAAPNDDEQRSTCSRDPARVFILEYVRKDPTTDEVAERVGLTPRQVRTRIDNAYRKLRDTLEERAMRGVALGA